MSIPIAKAKEVSDALMDAGYEPRLVRNQDNSWSVKATANALDVNAIQAFAAAHAVNAVINGEVVF